MNRSSNTTVPGAPQETSARPASPEPGASSVPGALGEALQRVRRFLYHFNAQLTYFPPPVRVAYALEGFGELGDLLQGDYRLNVPRGAGALPLGLGFECRGDAAPLVRQVSGTRAVIQQHTDYLRQHGLSFSVEEVYADARLGPGPAEARQVAFHIEPRVPVSVTFDAATGEGGVRLHAWNLERLGRVSYPLRPEAVTEELLNELARAVLREPNRLNAMVGFQVPEETRERLRERIYLEARAKALELAGAQARERPRGLLACLVGRGRNRS
jgi:hypothetical protein